MTLLRHSLHYRPSREHRRSECRATAKYVQYATHKRGYNMETTDTWWQKTAVVLKNKNINIFQYKVFSRVEETCAVFKQRLLDEKKKTSAISLLLTDECCDCHPSLAERENKRHLRHATIPPYDQSLCPMTDTAWTTDFTSWIICWAP